MSRPTLIQCVDDDSVIRRRDGDLAVRRVNDEVRRVFPLRRDRQLHLLVNVTLEEARAVGRAVTLLGQNLSPCECRRLPCFSLTPEFAGVQHRISRTRPRQRREDDDFVTALRTR